MAHTNGTIPSRFCHTRKLFEEVALLEFKLKRMTDDRDGTLKELRNVYLSVKENGYINLHDEESDTRITLIETKEGKAP